MADRPKLVAPAHLSKRFVIPTAVKRARAFISARVGRRDLAPGLQKSNLLQSNRFNRRFIWLEQAFRPADKVAKIFPALASEVNPSIGEAAL